MSSNALMSYVLVLFIGITITFFLPRLMPGDPINNYISQVQARAGQSLSAEATQQLRDSLAQLYGLEGDLFTQYLNYLGACRALRFWPLVHLLPGAGVRHPPGGIAVDGWAARDHHAAGLGDRQRDRAGGRLLQQATLGHCSSNSSAFSCTRSHTIFWRSSSSWCLPIWLSLFPLVADLSARPDVVGKAVSILYNSFLPALTLVLAGFGWNVLAMKSLAVSTKEDAYVQFARLKGTTDRTRMTNYVFRNAMLPQITALVLSLGFIFNGALQTEMIFSYPGIGFAMRSAAGAGDYNLLYGAIILTIFSVATAALDPRPDLSAV